MTSKDKSSRGGKAPAGRDSANRNRTGKPGGKPPAKRAAGDRPFGKSFDGDKSERPARARAADRTGDGDKRSAGRFGDDRPARSGKPGGKLAAKPRPAAASKDQFRAKPRPAPVETGEGEMKPERISKLLARAGVASRRDVERMIMDGRVRLNGELLDTPVVNATLKDVIEVDGQPIRGIERTRLWLYHKPAGLVTTNSDPEGRPTVFDNLPEDLPRVLSIGRLDINTEGLLLLTNDGGLSRVLELPSTGWLRRYRVRAHGEIDQAKLDTLKEGIAVDGVLYGGIDAVLDRQQGHNVWITMGLREGKNREIKNVLGALGLDVNRLIRLSYGPFQLGDLPEGAVVEVRGRMLRDQLGPRLIEEAKANFDAPIYNQPVKGGDEDEAEEAAPARRGKPERAERSGDERGERRGKPEGFGGKGPRGGDRGFGDRDRDDSQFDARPKRKPAGTSRTVNVWMAPGAKPLSEKQAARRGAIPNAKPVVASPDMKGPRVRVTRAAEDKDWIRAEGQAGGKKDEGGFGGRKRFGDRPDRAEGDRPERGDRPARAGGDRPQRSDRPFGDRPPRDRGDRPDRGERPARGERSFGDRPARAGGDRPERSDRPFGDRPPRDRGDRPDRSDRPPRGERSFGDRPARSGPRPASGEDRGAGRPARGAGKPGGGRPAGGKPGGGRPSGGKPGGGRPFGGKPGGPRGKRG